jgi:hypothetical protein
MPRLFAVMVGLSESGAATSSGRVSMIDTSVPIQSGENTHFFTSEVMGKRGLIIVGVGKAGDNGYEMLYRFSSIRDRLVQYGINVIFVYEKEGAGQVISGMSSFSTRGKQTPCLFLDDDGHFFRTPRGPKSLRALHLDDKMTCIESVEITLQGEAWDPLLRAFFAQVLARCFN